MRTLQKAVSQKNLQIIDIILSLTTPDGSCAEQLLKYTLQQDAYPNAFFSILGDEFNAQIVCGIRLEVLGLLPPLPAQWPPEGGGKSPGPSPQTVDLLVRLVSLGPSCISFEPVGDVDHGCTILHKVLRSVLGVKLHQY